MALILLLILAICALLVINLPCNVVAFVPDRMMGIVGPMGRFHTTITESALGRVARNYFNTLQATNQKPAIDETITDVSEMFKAVYGDKSGATYYYDVRRDITKAVAEVDANPKTKSNPAHHVDAERIVDANKKIVDNFNLLLSLLKTNQYEAARKTLGNTFHIIQDFYSHTNWIEMGHQEPNYALGIPGNESRIGAVAPETVATCINCIQTLNGINHNELLKSVTAGGFIIDLLGVGGGDLNNIFECAENIKINSSAQYLTSGYYTDEHDDEERLVDKPSTVGKCSHGGILDKTSFKPATGGINKDSTNIIFSPHSDLHFMAANMAENASVYWLERLRQQLNNDSIFGQFLQLVSGTSLAFAIDISASMAPYVDKIKARINTIVDGYQQKGSTSRPSMLLLITFDSEKVNEPLPFQEISLFRNVLDGLFVDKNNPSGPTRKIYDALELASRDSMIGGHLFGLTDGKPDESQSASTFQLLQENIRRKQLTLDVFVDKQIGRRRRSPSRDILKGLFGMVKEVNVAALLFRMAHRSGGNLFVTTSSGSISSGVDKAGLSQFGVLSKFQQMATVLKMQSAGSQPLVEKFYIDNSISKFTIIITSQYDIPTDIVISDPQGRKAAVEQIITQTETILIEMFDSTALKGVWQIQIQANHNQEYSLEIRGDAIMLIGIRFHKFEKNTAHPGTMEIRSNPVIGSQLIVEISVSGNTSDLVPYTIQLLDVETSRVFVQTSAVISSDRPNTIIANIDRIPPEPFLIAGSGYDSAGHYVRRIKPEIQTPSYLAISACSTLKSSSTPNSELLIRGQEMEISANITNYYTTPVLLTIRVQDTRKFVQSYRPHGNLLLASKSVVVKVKLLANDTIPVGTVSDFYIIALGNSDFHSNVYHEMIVVG